jgi:hypothetical protein
MKKNFVLILLILVSCQKRSLDSASMFTRSGQLKDKIALVEMIDSSAMEHKWNVASELTSYLQKELGRKDNLYVMPIGQELHLSSSKNPFSKEIDWLSDHFAHTQYVAFSELLKYEEQLQEDPTVGHKLDLSCRVRVFENTGQGFRVVLQEIVQESYIIPSLFTTSLSLQPEYHTTGYDLSPLGVAHQNFSSLISKRIRDYIKP